MNFRALFTLLALGLSTALAGAPQSDDKPKKKKEAAPAKKKKPESKFKLPEIPQFDTTLLGPLPTMVTRRKSLLTGEADTWIFPAQTIQTQCMRLQPGQILTEEVDGKQQKIKTCFPKPKQSFDGVDWIVRKIKPFKTEGECIRRVQQIENENSPWRKLSFEQRITKLQSLVDKIEFPDEHPYDSIPWKQALPCLAGVETEDLEPLSTAYSNCGDGEWQTSRGLFHVTQETIQDLKTRKGSDGKLLMRGLVGTEESLTAAGIHDVLAASVPLQLRVAANVLAEKYRTAERVLTPEYPYLLRKSFELYNSADKKEYYGKGVMVCTDNLKKGTMPATLAIKEGHCIAHPNEQLFNFKEDSRDDWIAYCQCHVRANTAPKEAVCKTKLSQSSSVSSVSSR